MAKVLRLEQLTKKRYKQMEDLPPHIQSSFGLLPYNFRMLVWGQSGNGKSNFIMQFVKILIPYGDVLYVSLEEGFESSFQMNVLRHLGEVVSGIQFADHNMKYSQLVARLKKKRSARFIVIDSIQYWKITIDQYHALCEQFPDKTFIFISHAEGKLPRGKVADDIRYDAGVKVRVDGYLGFVQSRYGGNNPYVIWEDGARRWWGDQYDKILKGVIQSPVKAKPKEKSVKEKLSPKAKSNSKPETTETE